MDIMWHVLTKYIQLHVHCQVGFFILLCRFGKLNLFFGSCHWWFSRQRLGRFDCGLKNGDFPFHFKSSISFEGQSLLSPPYLHSYPHQFDRRIFPAICQVMTIVHVPDLLAGMEQIGCSPSSIFRVYGFVVSRRPRMFQHLVFWLWDVNPRGVNLGHHRPEHRTGFLGCEPFRVSGHNAEEPHSS